MKALSQTQITRCEESSKARCKCRCRGALHGLRQSGYRQVLLIADDENAHLRREPATDGQPPVVAYTDAP